MPRIAPGLLAEGIMALRTHIRATIAAGGIVLSFLTAGSAAGKAAPAREEVAVIETPQGRMVMRFFPEEAPGHVAYVKDLIRRGFYQGTTFHRVIPYFVIQGGDPNSRDADRNNDGEGEGDRRLKAEFSQSLHYRPGTVGMARNDDPDSGSCQFFIALGNLPRLDGRYTIFGELIEGLEVARRIADLPRDLKDNPLERVSMKVALKTGKVPGLVNSLQQEAGGEILSGPGKPKPWDPGSTRWSSPALTRSPDQPLGTEKWPATPLDISVGADGAVLDVRFARLEVPGAAGIVAAVKRWTFTPARYDGRPVKSRFAMDSLGAGPEPSVAPGTPRQAGDGIQAPSAVVAVALPAGTKPPGKQALVRLAVDETGHVSDAAMEIFSGVPSLDEAALAAARKMLFSPALNGKEPVPAYLNLPVLFVEAHSP
jgi:peptidyl-prolyl cis-trans isomerase B (cyclophilin B)